jgi:hypothetical protein
VTGSSQSGAPLSPPSVRPPDIQLLSTPLRSLGFPQSRAALPKRQQPTFPSHPPASAPFRPSFLTFSCSSQHISIPFPLSRLPLSTSIPLLLQDLLGLYTFVMSARKRKQDDEELVALPSDESEEEGRYVDLALLRRYSLIAPWALVVFSLDRQSNALLCAIYVAIRLRVARVACLSATCRDALRQHPEPDTTNASIIHACIQTCR